MEGGIFATLDPSWSRPSAYPTRGTISLDAFSQNMALYSDDDRAAITCVIEGTQPPITGEDGLRAMEVALMAYESARSSAMRIAILGLALSHPYLFADILSGRGHRISAVWDYHRDHFAHARLSLEAGIPTYVDRLLTLAPADAEALVGIGTVPRPSGLPGAGQHLAGRPDPLRRRADEHGHPCGGPDQAAFLLRGAGGRLATIQMVCSTERHHYALSVTGTGADRRWQFPDPHLAGAARRNGRPGTNTSSRQAGGGPQAQGGTYVDDMIQLYPNAEGVQAKIRSRLPNCSRGERRVADYILENSAQMIYQSVTEVGVATGTSEATVIRFCQALGYRGYHEFKVALAQDLVVPTPAQSDEVRPDDPLPTIATKLMTHNIQVLHDTMRVLDMALLERAVDAVVRARKVEFYGVGASGVTAADARYKFMRIGTMCDAPPDPNIQAMSAAMLTPQDVAVGISWSGSNKDTLHVLKTAREAGARVIVVTNFIKSPVTEVADLVLLTASRETPAQSGSLASKIAQIFVLDLLFTSVVMRNMDKARLANEKAGRAILERMV